MIGDAWPGQVLRSFCSGSAWCEGTTFNGLWPDNVRPPNLSNIIVCLYRRERCEGKRRVTPILLATWLLLRSKYAPPVTSTGRETAARGFGEGEAYKVSHICGTTVVTVAVKSRQLPTARIVLPLTLLAYSYSILSACRMPNIIKGLMRRRPCRCFDIYSSSVLRTNAILIPPCARKTSHPSSTPRLQRLETLQFSGFFTGDGSDLVFVRHVGVDVLICFDRCALCEFVDIRSKPYGLSASAIHSTEN